MGSLKVNRLKEKLEDQSGVAIVEFCLMLPILVIILMFLLIIYEYNLKQVTVLEELRYGMRKSIDDNAASPFRHRTVTESLFVEIPGRMKNVVGKPFIRESMTLSFYEGCNQGIGKNKYRVKYADRYRINDLYEELSR